MRTLLTFSFGLFMLTSCGNSTQTQDKTTENSATVETSIPADLVYEILEETKNESISKCNLDIKLSRKITKEELTTLALKLRETRQSYNHLWIGYTLDNMKVGAGAWATSHFTPELEVQILGATAEEENNLNKSAGKIDGKQIGKWFEQQATSASYLFYEKNNKFFMKTTFKDGSMMESKINKKKVSSGLKLSDPEDTNGEYYIISKSGELEFYNKEDKKFATGQPVK